MTGACWSTAVCTEAERRALGLASDGEWLLTCRLSDGHPGDHATDASARARSDRRTWLTWDDSPAPLHRLIDADPCPVRSRTGTPCLLFGGHGGLHYYGAPASPGSPPAPSAIESADVRMPTGPSDLNRHRPVSSTASAPTAAGSRPRMPHEPIDVETTGGPPTNPNPAARTGEPRGPARPVNSTPIPNSVPAPDSVPVSKAAPASAPTAEREPDAVAAALAELATAIENLAEALRGGLPRR
ncbi:hypothetical protein GOARA_068_00340 [Gordonia araii NBRC 100433]|uniref:Uncharacterized protein n=1 Tax=Gordonia araii NBRC 100433 TaxID=1073574 RepID=G7H6A0_9ACTN|nr:hypothetical protein [Gordonia araii]NNG96056.1 hypothetical protein [Gordonia araii NBRC 100433]GAB11375.1 hypothetical protein GOARA_068_00340 [Gordonia araii NBRC 100433]